MSDSIGDTSEECGCMWMGWRSALTVKVGTRTMVYLQMGENSDVFMSLHL